MSDLTYTYDGDIHEVVAIEYMADRPFAVMTMARGTPHFWDFNWCKRDEMYYPYMSGFGGDGLYRVSPFVEPDPPKAKLWVAPRVPIVRHGSSSRLREKTILKMGYLRVPEPLLLNGMNPNPFECDLEMYYEGMEYCSRCDDQFPRDLLCDHLMYCDWCGECVDVDTHSSSNGNAPGAEWRCKLSQIANPCSDLFGVIYHRDPEEIYRWCWASDRFRMISFLSEQLGIFVDEEFASPKNPSFELVKEKLEQRLGVPVTG